MFKPAGKVKKHLKIAVYGEAGTGKTWFALQAQGKKAVIDTENGTDFYGTKFDFDVLKTRSYREVISALDHIEKANQYDVLVIDPITNIYQTLKDAAQLAAEVRAKKNNKNEDDANLTFRDWGIVKNKFNSLISRLCNLQCHVVITGWQKDVYEGTGENMRKVGSRIDADKKAEHQPDIIIRLEVDKNGNRYGLIEKDRTMTYKKGQRIKDISFNHFLGSLNNDGDLSEITTEEDAATEELDITEETTTAIKNKWTQLGYNPSHINEQTKKIYNLPLDELSQVQGADFLTKLGKAQPKTANEQQPEQQEDVKKKKPRNRYAALFAAGKERGLNQNQVKEQVYKKLDITSLTTLSDSELAEVAQWIKSDDTLISEVDETEANRKKLIENMKKTTDSWTQKVS